MTSKRIFHATMIAAVLMGNAQAATAPDGSFSHATSVCRFFHGGRASQRVNLRSTDPQMSACLRSRGWWTDGTRTLDDHALDTR